MKKLSTWAKENNISYDTAWRWVKKGIFPGKTYQAPTGRFFVVEEPKPDAHKEHEKNLIYCRVSNHSRKNELNYQVERCRQFALANGWSVEKTYKEVASGMNDKRPELWKAITDKPSRIIVENKDRLTRFGFTYLQRLLKEQGTEIVVINDSHVDREDLIKDLCSIIYSFCARLYGMRRAHKKAKEVRDNVLAD